MTTSASKYRFTAPIVARGKTESGTAFVTFGWKLPGSRYNFQVYGKATEELSEYPIDTLLTVIITQGRLRDGKEGTYNSDYYWDISSVETGVDVVPMPAEQAHPSGKGSLDMSQVPRRTWDATGASIERQVALKAAVELAGYKIAAGQDLGAKEVMQVATWFDRWLGRNFDLEAPQEATADAGEAGAVAGTGDP